MRNQELSKEEDLLKKYINEIDKNCKTRLVTQNVEKELSRKLSPVKQHLKHWKSKVLSPEIDSYYYSKHYSAEEHISTVKELGLNV